MRQPVVPVVIAIILACIVCGARAEDVFTLSANSTSGPPITA